MKIACPNCGANIIFDVKTQQCYCGHCNTFIKTSEINNLEINREMACSSCGARLLLAETEIITNCVYCGSTELFSRRLENNPKRFKPDEILPFKIDKEKAFNLYRNYIKKHKKIIKETANEEIIFNNLKGIYVPCCLYIWKLKVYHYKRKKDILYEEIKLDIRDVSWKVKDEVMQELQPFDIENLVVFSPMYFASFYAEIADETIFIKNGEIPSKFVSGKPYKKAMKKIYSDMENATKHELYSIQTKIDLLDKKAIFLPIWFFSINHRIKFYINGRTGKIVCFLKDENGKNQVYDKKKKILSKNKVIDVNKRYKFNTILTIFKYLFCGILLFTLFLICYVFIIKSIS